MSSLDLIYNKQTVSSNSKIFLICVIRDELLLLEYFIQHYMEIGVTDFIFVDNGSIDGGIDYLKSLDKINIRIYYTDKSYKNSNFGVDWVCHLLDKYCKNQYVFVVDVDELFVFDKSKYGSFREYIKYLEDNNKNVVSTLLLDMYPRLINDDYVEGKKFWEHSNYYDRFNNKYYNVGDSIYSSFYHITGGVRKRVFNTTVCIQKFPFFKYNFYPIRISAGYHFFEVKNKVIQKSDRIKLLNNTALLLHFKFIKPNLLNYFESRVYRNQDWNDSIEYKSYVGSVKKTSNNEIKIYDKKYSLKINSIDALIRSFRVYR